MEEMKNLATARSGLVDRKLQGETEHGGGRLAAPSAEQLDLLLISNAARDVGDPAHDSENAKYREERGDSTLGPREQRHEHEKDGEDGQERGGEAGLACVSVPQERLDRGKSTVIICHQPGLLD
jgi:hypothetical protein